LSDMSEYCLLLRKDLTGPLATVHWPADVSLVALDENLMQPVHALLSQGYSDGSGNIDSFEKWRHSLLHDAEYDPQLCLIAMRSGVVVGVAQGWTSAYLKDLVVHAGHQGQGIGQALLARMFAVYAQRGEPCVDLKVMEDNTKARRLYERAGMVQVKRIEL